MQRACPSATSLSLTTLFVSIKSLIMHNTCVCLYLSYSQNLSRAMRSPYLSSFQLLAKYLIFQQNRIKSSSIDKLNQFEPFVSSSLSARWLDSAISHATIQ